jgi:hypothetical protein
VNRVIRRSHGRCRRSWQLPHGLAELSAESLHGPRSRNRSRHLCPSDRRPRHRPVRLGGRERRTEGQGTAGASWPPPPDEAGPLAHRSYARHARVRPCPGSEHAGAEAVPAKPLPISPFSSGDDQQQRLTENPIHSVPGAPTATVSPLVDLLGHSRVLDDATARTTRSTSAGVLRMLGPSRTYRLA